MPDESLVGKTIGNYKILQEVGRGGMGVVYKAHETTLQRIVALKILPPHIANDAAFVKRFEREARFAASLSHPNIVAIHAVGQEGPYHYIAMEYVKGKTLAKLLREAGRLSVNRALEIALAAAEALTEAHDMGMVHRDIKPDNIMIDESGRVKVMDFGLARGVHSTTELTAKGAVIGTPRYMSPEQCEGHKPDHRTDVYSLGVVLFEMLTGSTPYAAETPLALMRHIVETPLPSIQTISADVAPHVCSIVYKMTAKRADDRYATARDVAIDIKALIQEREERPLTNSSQHDTATRRITPLEALSALTPAWRSGARRYRVPALAVGVLLLLLAAGAVLGIRGLLGGDDRPPGELVHDGGVEETEREGAIPAAAVPYPLELSGVEGEPPPLRVVRPTEEPVERSVPTPVTVQPEPVAAVPEGAARVVFGVSEITLDPDTPERSLNFTVEPADAPRDLITWYAGGPLSVKIDGDTATVRTSEIDLPLGGEAVYRVFARHEVSGIELGSLNVRLRNPIRLARFEASPVQLALGPGNPSGRVEFDVTDAAGKAVTGDALSFSLSPSGTPVVITRDGPNALVVRVDESAALTTTLTGRIDALLRGEPVGEVPLTIAPMCAVSQVEFAAGGLVLSNRDTTSEVFFKTVPEEVDETQLAELSFKANDPRILVTRMSTNVLEVALDPATPLLGGETQVREVAAYMCGRNVGVLPVELVPFSQVPQVIFAKSNVRLTNVDRAATVRFEVTPEGAPDAVLKSLNFRADSYDLVVTRDELRAITVSLRQTANIESAETEPRLVTAWYDGQAVGTVEVELVPFANLPEVRFEERRPRLTNTERRALLTFTVHPPGLSQDVLDNLRFRADTEDVLVNRLGAQQIELVLGPFVRLESGVLRDVAVTARYRNTTVGETRCVLAGPSSIESVQAQPSQVELSPSAPTAYINLSARPASVPEEEFQQLDFSLEERDGRISWRRTRSGDLVVSMVVNSFDPGEQTNNRLVIFAGGRAVGEIGVSAVRPVALEEVSFIPSAVTLTSEQSRARVSFTTNPAGMSISALEWQADTGVGVRYLGERMLELSAPASAFETGSRTEKRIYARLGGETIGTLPVTIAGVKLPFYRRASFGSINVTYPAEIRAGERALVEVSAVNWRARAEEAELGVSLQGAAPRVPPAAAGDHQVIEPGVDPVQPYEMTSGGVLQAADRRRLATQPLVVKRLASWAPETQAMLRFPVTFGQPGQAQLFLRVTFFDTSGPARRVIENFPAHGVADQQGIPVRAFDVTVVE